MPLAPQAEVFVVRIVKCTNEGFIELDKRDPAGLYIGNLRGTSWLPMALVAAELCESYEEAVALELGARQNAVGFSFEIVRLAIGRRSSSRSCRCPQCGWPGHHRVRARGSPRGGDDHRRAPMTRSSTAEEGNFLAEARSLIRRNLDIVRGGR